jgi:hypothetical protein
MLILTIACYLASALLVLPAPLLEEAGINATAPPEFSMSVYLTIPGSAAIDTSPL